MLKDIVNVLGSAYGNTDSSNVVHTLGNKRYELSNHLGNVLTVISDKPIPHNNGGTVDYWQADIKSAYDYSPFGVTLSGRDFNSSESRYGFGGQEKDDEVSGKGNSYTAEFWQYDSRLGRRWNIDPMAPDYSWQSPYATFNNNPIFFIDPLGLEGTDPTDPPKNSAGSVVGTEKDAVKLDEFVLKPPAKTEQNPSSSNDYSNFSPYKKGGPGDPEWERRSSGRAESVFIIDGIVDLTTHYLAKGFEYFGMEKETAKSAANITVFSASFFLTRKLPKGNVAKTGFSVNPSKFDYFFGRVTTGNAHNVTRSAQNLKDLTKMGVTNESQLSTVFNQAFNSGKIISTNTTQYGTTIMKRVNVGSNGSIDVGFFYQGGNMSTTPSITTIIPKTW